jgi:type I restriction enzyme S subunit
MSDLPTGWAETTLSMIASITTGNTPSTKNPELYGGSVPFAKPGDLDTQAPITSTEQCLSEEGASQARLLRTGAVLVSCIGNLGKVGIAGTSLATNQQINSAEFYPFIVDDRYGYYVCKTLKPWMEREASATTIAILNKGRFSEAPFPLAPHPEQKRIADKLDSVLARVDACRDRLDRLPALLKRFRQSILAAATSGRLTEDWREQNAIGNESWNYPMIGELVAIKNGRAFPSTDYADEGIRLIRPGNLHHSGSVQWSVKNTTHLPESYAREFPTFVLGKDELLMNLTAQSLKDDFLGRVCLKTDSVPALLNQRICAFYSKSSSDIRPYLFVYFRSPVFRSYVDTLDSGTLIKHMHTKQLLSHAIPFPTEAEQTEIVRRVEILFAFADRVEARLATARRQVGQLTPALLAKAFRGELVPQDPADEPAAELLKRLAAQREAAPKAKRTRAKS